MLRSLVIKIFSNLYEKSNGRIIYLSDLDEECKKTYGLFFHRDKILADFLVEDNFATIVDDKYKFVLPFIIINNIKQLEGKIDKKDIVKLKKEVISDLISEF